jgi:hypothetical protein
MVNLRDIFDIADKLFADFRPYSGYVLVLYGLLECYFASRFFRYFMALTGFLLSPLIGSWVSMKWIEMLLLRYIVIGFLGIGIGVLFYFNRRVRIFMKGFLVFFIACNAILHLFNVTPNNILLLGMAILGGLIFIISDRGTRIVGLSALGSFLFLYGCLITWGWNTYQEMSFVLDTVNPDFRLIGFILGWILLFSTGVIFQIKLTSPR